ncbi:MAG: flagellar basal body rod protein FlgB [Betaproteobacteria bacterium]|nr:flagellar basal body rod protein FlgB [Betaproteobacteria bacterium]
MNSKLDKAVNYLHQALNVRVARQELLSSNIANADTPSFKAKDIEFANVLNDRLSSSGVHKTGLTTTSPMHFDLKNAKGVLGDHTLYRVPLQPSADGNTVDMDVERTRFADNSIKYDANLTFINGQFRGLLSAIQER